MKPRVFISAVSAEFRGAREAVAKQLEQMGFEAVYQDAWGTRGGYLLDDLRKLVSTAQVFVQLVGKFPGERPPQEVEGHPGASYTHLEYFEARAWPRARAQDILIFFVAEASDTPVAPLTAESVALQSSYVKELESSGLRLESVKNTDALINAIARLQWTIDRVRNWYEVLQASTAPHLAPPQRVTRAIRGFTLAALHYSNESLRWQDRAEMIELEQFLKHPAPFLWWVVTGEGGVGKSRLARQLMLNHEGDWSVGTLSPDDLWWDTNHWVPTAQTLIVVDYAAARRNWGDALHRLNWVSSKLARVMTDVKLRVLLLIRPDGFASFLKGTTQDGRFTTVRGARYSKGVATATGGEQKEAAEDQRLIRRSEALGLEPVASLLPDAVKSVLDSIEIDEIREVKARLPPVSDSAFWDGLQKKTAGGRWLLIQIYAWLFALKESEKIRREAQQSRDDKPDIGTAKDGTVDFEVAESFEKLLRAFLVREIRHWKLHHGPARHSDERDKDRVITVLAIATLQQGLERGAFAKLSELRRMTPKQRSILWRRCQTILGGQESDPTLQPVEPDLAGEALVVQALSTLGWDDDAPGEGHFVSPILPNEALAPTEKVIRHILAENGNGLGRFLGLIGRDFVDHSVTTGLFMLASQLVLFDREFTANDDLLAALFDYGFGEYDQSVPRPQKFADRLVTALAQRTEVQQYLYDSGLMERYSTYLAQLVAAPPAEGGPENVLDQVLKLKLNGHRFYRSNSTECRASFDQALELIDRLEPADVEALGDKAWLLPWYRLFFHDHHANDMSKNDQLFARAKARDYLDHREKALQAVPERLKTGREQPTPEDLPLLIRSAHLCGHFGNQATRVFDSFLEDEGEKVKSEEVEAQLREGQAAYLRAALFRLAAYRTSFPARKNTKGKNKPGVTRETEAVGEAEFLRAVETMRGLSPTEGQWLKAFVRQPVIDAPREHFMHRSQALGDTAHQLVGAAKLHYQAFVLSWSDEKLAEQTTLREAGERFRLAGNALWDTSAKVAELEGAHVIQYFVWTIETDLQSELTDAALRGGAGAVREFELETELARRLKAVEERRIRYPDAVEKIQKAIRKFRDQLLRALGAGQPPPKG